MRYARFLAAVVAAAVVLSAGCGGTKIKSGVHARSGKAPPLWRPRMTLLLYPIVLVNAVDRNVHLGVRPYMGSEMAAIAHVNCRKRMSEQGMPRWKDATAEAKAKQRLTLLGTVIHREYNRTGIPPKRVLGELSRVTGADAILIVEIFKFGPSNEKFELLDATGKFRPVRFVAEPASEGWLNCGIRIAFVKCGGATVIWEASYLVSRPRSESVVQEELVAECVRKIMNQFPYRNPS